MGRGFETMLEWRDRARCGFRYGAWSFAGNYRGPENNSRTARRATRERYQDMKQLRLPTEEEDAIWTGSISERRGKAEWGYKGS